MYNIISGLKLNIFKQSESLLMLILSNSYLSTKVLSLSGKMQEVKWKQTLNNAGIPKVDEIFTYTNVRELRVLYNLASNNCTQGASALEIGSHLGASSCYIAAGLKEVNGHLFCVDTWCNQTMPEGELDTFPEFQKNTSGLKQHITIIRKRSEEIDYSDIKAPLNLVFIDGDHSYAAVKTDFECVQKWLAEDGIIAFHDFSNIDYEGVTRVVGEALASGKWMIAGQVDSLVWIKLAKWLQPIW